MRELILFLLLGIATLNAQKNVQSISYKNEKIEIYNTDLIVKVKTQHKSAFEEMFLNRNDIKVNTKRKSKYYQLVHVNKVENLLKVKEELEATKFFEFVEFNTLGKAEITPNDNYYNSGQQYAVNKIRLPEAWDVTTGNTNIIVGILDSGIPKSNSNLSHSELNDISKYIDGIDATDEIDGSIKDEYGHGAHVLGIVGALSNNSDGIVGAKLEFKI